MLRRVGLVGAAAAVVFASLGFAPAAHADVSGTWTNSGGLVGSDCVTSWTGQSSYSLPEASIIKISLAAGGSASCSVTIKSADLSTWQISLDSGASWTTLFGTFEGLPANGGPQQIWYRVGRTSATIGSGDYTGAQYGVGFQLPVISITPILEAGSAELTFSLPDGRECGSISPVSVPIDSLFVLPEPGADCKTSDGSTVVGWKVGWDDLVHPPGHPVLVVDSQQFTAVIKEEVLTVEYDANVAAADSCLIGKANVPVPSRSISQEVDRGDLQDYRVMVEPICTPPGHYFAGWSTEAGSELLRLGSPAPASWLSTQANSVTLFAQWRPIPPVVIDIDAFPSGIPTITPVQVMVGSVTPQPGGVSNGTFTITSAVDPKVQSASPVMSQAIDDFFANGGTSLTIVPAQASDAATLVSAIGSIDVPNALDLSAPEIRGLAPVEWITVASALVDKASAIRAVAWLDPPSTVVAVPASEQLQAINGVVSLAQQLRGQVSGGENAGTLLSSGVIDSAGVPRAASPAVLGVRALTDQQYGVWETLGPGYGLSGVTSEVPPTNAEVGTLTINGVSPVFNFPTGETIIAPNVTLNRMVRTTAQRFEDWLVQSVTAGLAQYKEFPNDQSTWMSMMAEISAFLVSIWNAGALYGNTASQAFSVQCSATAQQVDDGVVQCDIGYSAVFPGEQVRFTVLQPVVPGKVTSPISQGANPTLGVVGGPPMLDGPRPGIYINE